MRSQLTRHQSALMYREPRGQKKHYLYSKIMMWVAIDRGLRLAEKRCLPCPHKSHWTETRDSLYEQIQTKGWK